MVTLFSILTFISFVLFWAIPAGSYVMIDYSVEHGYATDATRRHTVIAASILWVVSIIGLGLFGHLLGTSLGM